MEKLPVTPSPYRFLLKNKNNADPLLASRHQPNSSQINPGFSASDAPKTAAAFELASTATAKRRINTRPSGNNITTSRAAAEFRTPDRLGTPNVGTEDVAYAPHNATNATAAGSMHSTSLAFGTTPTKMESMWSSQEEARNSSLSHATTQQIQTPQISQFKAAPKFRLGSSQNRSQSGSGADRERAGNELGSHATPRPTQGKWRATQTPLRQTLWREVAEEEIVDVVEGEMLMEDVRESVERDDRDEEGEDHAHQSIALPNFTTPGPKRRKVSIDPVESFSFSRNQHDETVSSQHHGNLHEHEDRVRNDNEGNECYDNDDEELLYNHGNEEEEQPGLDDMATTTTSQTSISSHAQPATPAPTFFQRPRFILPSSVRGSRAPPATPQTRDSPHVPDTFAPTPHFILHTSTPTNNPADDNEPQFTKPPKFRPIEEPEPSEPLPPEFSPRKRGQKFMIGGLANEVRSWLVDLEAQTSATRPHKDDEGWAVKMLVEDVSPPKGVEWTLARGHMQDGNELCMILGGEGMMEGLEKGKEVPKGAVVGIKAPVWEVEVEGVRWGVGANWKTWARGS